jgi:transposase
MEVIVMSNIRIQYDEDFKKNAVKISYASPKAIADVANDLGIKPKRLYAWRKKYTAEGDKTRFATLEEENKALRLQVAQLAMERDMLKKATAYFANLKG